LAGIRHGEILLVEEMTRRIVVQRTVCLPHRRSSRKSDPSQ
jgi:hypothetical protein